jgi:hypothetical protein
MQGIEKTQIGSGVELYSVGGCRRNSLPLTKPSHINYNTAFTFTGMLRLLLICCFIVLHFSAMAQISDMISVRKKNGRLIKTFIAGAPVELQSVYSGHVNGWIRNIKNDTVFVKIYAIRTVAGFLGLPTVDTFGTYIAAINYKDIEKIKISQRQRFISSKLDKLLYIGGTGYFILNLINGGYLEQPITDKENLRKLGISLGAVGTGLLINKLFSTGNFSKRRHKIVYVRTK